MSVTYNNGSVNAGGSGISDVVDDTSPQLGGALDAQNNNITGIKQATFNSEVDDGNSGSSDTIDFSAGHLRKSTLTDDCTYTFTAPSGPCRVQLKVVQGGSGSYTVTWPGTVKWVGGAAPTLSTAVGAIDIVTFYFDGSNYHGVASLAFATP